MGGTGSGSWCRWDKKTTIEQTKRIDIRYLKKQGWLSCDRSGYFPVTLSWSSGGEPAGYINCRVYNNRMELDYRFCVGGGDWEPVKQTVYFDTTPCNYGGERKWFICPHCQRRVGILCGEGKYFLCRHCYRLPYRSENEGRIDRLISQKHKLGERIFERYDFGEGWGKRKGMHWKTYNRLLELYNATSREIDGLIANHMLGLSGF